MAGILGAIGNMEQENRENAQQDAFSFKPMNKKEYLELCKHDKQKAACELFRALRPCPCGCKLQMKVAPGKRIILICSFCGWKTRPRQLQDMTQFAFLDTDSEIVQEQEEDDGNDR